MFNISLESVKKSIELLVKEKEGCCYYYLDTIDNNNYAIVFGWSDGFDIDEKDIFSDGTWHICGKVAYQPKNSIMQCDYDVDWEMPYDEETMEVDIVDIPIYDIKKDLICLIENAERIIKERKGE